MKIQFLPLMMSASIALFSSSFDLPTASIAVVYPSAAVKPSYTTNALPAFAWTETTFDFGKIKQNNPVTHEFRFVNKGAEPLLITSVQASCGCTVAKYSRDAIAPGAEGFVTATYNAANKGIFNKSVTVNANTQDGVVVLAIRGEVE
jgi:hypothetical protein